MKSLISAFLLLSAVAANACSVCGGSGSDQSLGLLPQFNAHFIGLQYQCSAFHSEHPDKDNTKEISDQQYNKLQLWGRYRIGQRIQLFGFVPYSYNIHIQDGQKQYTSGFGDASVLVNVVAINKNSKEWKHTLLGGGGIKAPTGKYTGVTEMDKLGLPNTQPGTGSWDFLVNANYTARYKNWGVNTDASYTFTTTTKDNYKYGNRLNTGLNFFYRHAKEQLTILPQLGAKFEYTLHDYDNFPKRWLNLQTGGTMLFATAGIQAYYKKIGLQCQYYQPIHQNYAAGMVNAKGRAEAGILFLL